MNSVISIRDFARADIELLIKEASLRKKGLSKKGIKADTKIASLFFENSTRTRISSETAAVNMGGYINGFSGIEGTSVKKGEPLIDTVKMLEGYGYSAIIMRHNLAGAARYAADCLSIPVINGGDGSSGHPTQTLLDLFTISEAKGKIDGLKIAMVGDLKYGRTVHSLLQALEVFNARVFLVSPENLSMPDWRVADYEKNTGRRAEKTTDLPNVLKTADVIYMTRIQRERFPAGIEGDNEFRRVSGMFVINRKLLEKHANKGLIILHPLPRDKNHIEIATDVDATGHALYFVQAQNGLYMREAIISRMFGSGFLGREKGPLQREATWIDLPIKNGAKRGEKLLYRLDEGTLIDHIEGGRGMSVYNHLGLEKIARSEIVVALNINSKRSGKKDVLAIHRRSLSPEELYKLALLSPKHTINIIKEKRVIKKMRAVLPSPLSGMIVCKNPLCISRREHNEFVESKFYVEHDDPLHARCYYCEQVQKGAEIELI